MPLSPEAPSVTLFHRDLGGSGDPPMVLLHGLLGSSRNWQTSGRDLASARRVFALDLRNHGMSPHAESMSYASMAADVVAWLDSHGMGRVELVGHSMGGKVAMLLACRHPERVARLVVADMAPRDYGGAVHRAEVAAMNGLDLGNLRSRAEAEARLEPSISDLGMRKFVLTNLERVPEGGWRWQINLPVITASLPELAANPLAAGERFEGPALFIAGGRSNYIRLRDRGTILGHFPSARIETLPDSGHNPHIDAREAFVKAVTSPD